MCVACVEYIRDKLTASELKNALHEMTVDDSAHREQVEDLIRNWSGKPEELKKKLGELAKK